MLALTMNNGQVHVLIGEYEDTLGSTVVMDVYSSACVEVVGVSHKRLVFRLMSEVPLIDTDNPRLSTLISNSAQHNNIGAKRQALLNVNEIAQ